MEKKEYPAGRMWFLWTFMAFCYICFFQSHHLFNLISSGKNLAEKANWDAYLMVSPAVLELSIIIAPILGVWIPYSRFLRTEKEQAFFSKYFLVSALLVFFITSLLEFLVSFTDLNAYYYGGVETSLRPYDYIWIPLILVIYLVHKYLQKKWLNFQADKEEEK